MKSYDKTFSRAMTGEASTNDSCQFEELHPC